LYYDGSDVDNVSYDDHPNNEYNVILADGTSVLFLWFSDCGRIRVDIDGPNKGKNAEGIDIFDFKISGYDSEAAGVVKNQMYPSSTPVNWTGTGEAHIFLYETAWVIRNGNMDYLKCADELDWETKTSCK